MKRRARALAALLLIWVGCAGAREPVRDSSGLVRVESSRRGNVFAHESRSIDDYDGIWLAEVGLQYAPGQTPLSDEDAQRLRKFLFDSQMAHFPIAESLAVEEVGPCTLKLAVHLVALEFPQIEMGQRRNGSATVVVEFRDSQTEEPLLRYGQRRELRTSAMRRGAPDLDRLEEVLRPVFEDATPSVSEALPVNAHGARASVGCKGAIGVIRATDAKS